MGLEFSQQPHFVTMKAMARQVRQHALMWSRTCGRGTTRRIQKDGFWSLEIKGKYYLTVPVLKLKSGRGYIVAVLKGTGRRGQRKVTAPMKTVQREIMISLIHLQETEKGLVRSLEDTTGDDFKCFLAAPHEFELPEASGFLNFRS